MPFRNAAPWIESTIVSIQDQAVHDWELFAVDDHSSDNSHALVERMAQNDDRIKLLINHEEGIIPALKLAFSKANGTYVTRMDADDIMPKNRFGLWLERIKGEAKRTVVTGQVAYFSEHALSAGYKAYETWLNERVTTGDFYKHIFRECVVASPNWITSTEAMREDRIIENLNYPEDYDMCFRWQANGYKILGVNETTLFWREHPLRTSRNSEIYDQPSFFDLKMSWFKHTFSKDQSIGIVGLGAKGKRCFHALVDYFNSLSLYEQDVEQFNQPYHNHAIQPPHNLNTDILLLARYPKDLKPIESLIEKQGYQIGINAFWV